MNTSTEELMIARFIASLDPYSGEGSGIADRDIAKRIAELGEYVYTNPATGRVSKLIPSGGPPGYKLVHVSSDPEVHNAATTGARSDQGPPSNPVRGRYRDIEPRPESSDPGTYSDAPSSRPERRGFGRRGPM